ncbi:MAG: hypothetical protein ACRCST_02620 [Turicibacter sp.]
MKSSNVEKRIVKLDQEIAAMNIAKKHLKNIDEINAVIVELNRDRQLLVNDLYLDDKEAYQMTLLYMEDMLNKELDANDQKELLELIKDKFGRQAATDGKTSTGLNAWLKKLNVEFEWKNIEGSEWATLVITGFGIFK